MGADQNLDWRRAAASALEWWRDAGVDVLVEDHACDWRAAPPASERATAPPIAARPAAAPPPVPDALPDTLDAFLAWRTGGTAPDARWSAHPIAPAGDPGADLMVLVDCPEPGDRESLMEGETGRLFDAMLAAIGRSRADILLAAVCTARPIGGRVPREIEARLGEIARHHLSLVAPKRALALGDAASRALTAMNVAEGRACLHPLNHKSGKTTEVVASFHPRFLLRRPALKAEAWKDLQMLIGGTK